MGKVLSIYISSTEIRVCELEQKGKSVTVSRAYESPIPAGLVEDGIILEMDELANALARTLADNGTRKGQLAFAVLSKKIAQKEIRLPYVKDDKKVTEMIRANLSEYFPMNNLGDYIIRHNILDTVEEEDEKKLIVQVFAFPKQIVESYFTLADMVRMPLLTIDYYYNSFYQLMRRQMNPTETALAIQMSRHNTQVSVMKGKIQQFKRPIAYGRSTLLSNLMEYRNIIESEAEMALHDPAYQEHILSPSDFQELIHNFAMSITRVVEYHTSRNPNINVDKVKLFGTGASIPNFANALGRELGVEIESITEFAGIRLNRSKQKDLSYELLENYMANIGILFGSLDVKLEEQKESNSFTTLMILLIVLAFIINAGLFVYMRFIKQNELRQEANNLQSDIDSLEIAEQFYQAYLAMQQDFGVIEGIYNDTKNPSEMLPVFISDMEDRIPATVGFTDLSVQDGDVIITGTCGGKAALAAFVIELKKLPYVKNVFVESLTDEEETKFTLNCKFVYMDDEEIYAAEDFGLEPGDEDEDSDDPDLEEGGDDFF